MRLNEEKILVVLMIIGVLIISITLLIQISDSKITDHNKELFIKQGKINNILLHRLESQSSMNRFELYEIIQPDINIPKENILSSLGLTGIECNKIKNEFQQGEITKKEYLTQMKELYSREYDKQFIQYNIEWPEAETMYSQGTPWQFWKKVFVIIEVILIVISIFGYYYLYKEIKERNYAKNTENK